MTRSILLALAFALLSGAVAQAQAPASTGAETLAEKDVPAARHLAASLQQAVRTGDGSRLCRRLRVQPALPERHRYARPHRVRDRQERLGRQAAAIRAAGRPPRLRTRQCRVRRFRNRDRRNQPDGCRAASAAPKDAGAWRERRRSRRWYSGARPAIATAIPAGRPWSTASAEPRGNERQICPIHNAVQP